MTDGKEEVCYVGKHVHISCKKDDKGRDIELNLVLFGSLKRGVGVKDYLKDVYKNEHSIIDACNKINLRWLLLNRLKLNYSR